MTDFLSTTRTFYDAIAEDYSERFRNELADRPLERAVLGLYAELVGAGGKVADLGCGPGRSTGHLSRLGLDIAGLDLSESMLAVARRENPAVPFHQGSMFDLPFADGSLDGVLCWYSSIHTPAAELPRLFTGFRDALAPGGHLLLAFQVGDEPRHYDQPWGHPVAIDFLRRRPEFMEDLLKRSGFTMLSRTVREATGEEKTPHAFLIAERAEASEDAEDTESAE
ncbi:methyltransferase domain-containing protein [Streptomyces sp. NPDC004539]|uniref:class I SAM-dependent DNA methyltransferase n=1 Tax=Streptomyces sp. NPDC004539 TaxID=3154280 RepID=UPI0033B07E84